MQMATATSNDRDDAIADWAKVQAWFPGATFQINGRREAPAAR